MVQRVAQGLDDSNGTAAISKSGKGTRARVKVLLCSGKTEFGIGSVHPLKNRVLIECR